MVMRTYVRRLKNCCLRSGYISAQLFKTAPKRLFLCIWPSGPNVKERAELLVRNCELPELRGNLPTYLVGTPEARNYEIVLKYSRLSHCEYGEKYFLKFEKTARAFDSEGFFWTAAKGHNFRVGSAEVNDTEIIFRAGRKNKNRYFLDMLQVVGKTDDKRSILLTEYLKQNFDVLSKNTYGFAIYIQVKFWSDTVEFRGSQEKVYRFAPISPFLGMTDEEFMGADPIYGVLYEYISGSTTDEDNDEKEILQPPPRLADPKTIEKYFPQQKVVATDLQLDVRNALKKSLQKFVEQMEQKTPTDDDYFELVDDVLRNLAKVDSDE